MPFVYRPRRPRASPLWQIVHHAWGDFLACYETRRRKTLGPLRPGAAATVEKFLRCGDLASGFTRFQCPDCGHERLLAFIPRPREPPLLPGLPPAAGALRRRLDRHLRLPRSPPPPIRLYHPQSAARHLLPRPRDRHLLTHLFHTAVTALQETFRTRLGLPGGRIGAVAAVHTFGDYLDHIPPKGQQTVRYYGVYSNKSRGLAPPPSARLVRHAAKTLHPSEAPRSTQILLIPAPPKRRARDMRPLWRDLILKVWGGDPLQCPCCKATMKPVRQFLRHGELEFFLRLHGLWQGIVHLPRPPPPPFDIETMEPVEPPWQAVKEWIPDDESDLDWFNQTRNPDEQERDRYDQSPAWNPPEIPLGDGRTLILESTRPRPAGTRKNPHSK